MPYNLLNDSLCGPGGGNERRRDRVATGQSVSTGLTTPIGPLLSTCV
jgi:hypothetical protein